MAIGQKIRRAFGQHERAIADLYRAMFVDLDAFIAQIRVWSPKALRILEVGCGEGAVTEKLATAYPLASILAIDITPRVGRLYSGRTEGVEFAQMPVQQVALAQPQSFDLVIMADVLHHIPAEMRGEIMDAIGLALAPEGRFILKEWANSHSPIHWLCHAGDRWLTGDHVEHLNPGAAQMLVTGRVPQLKMQAQAHIAPWHNNYAQLFSQ